MSYIQLNISELPGSTFMYSGLSKDNVASLANKYLSSNPMNFAKLSLYRMQTLLEMGVPQVILPPQRRPEKKLLVDCGFESNFGNSIAQADSFSRSFLESLFATSSVWTANAATVTPSVDSRDGKLHITTSNLHSCFHRSLESSETHLKLARIFSNKDLFCVHKPLPSHSKFSDEGAANHMRFAVSDELPGLNVFVYGSDPDTSSEPAGRQTLWASKAICQLHQLLKERVILQKQANDIISKGIFHNDIIAMNANDLLVFHEQAYEDKRDLLKTLNEMGVCCFSVNADEFSLDHALHTYFFNSEFITSKDGDLILIMSKLCEHDERVQTQLSRLRNTYGKKIGACYLDLNDSLRNGGGPACLRLRVPVNEKQYSAIPSGFLLTQQKLDSLKEVVEKNYYESLNYKDVLKTSFQERLDPVYCEIEKILGWNNN